MYRVSKVFPKLNLLSFSYYLDFALYVNESGVRTRSKEISWPTPITSLGIFLFIFMSKHEDSTSYQRVGIPYLFYLELNFKNVR